MTSAVVSVATNMAVGFAAGLAAAYLVQILKRRCILSCPYARQQRSIDVINYQIKCEAVAVRTDSGICPGMAKTQQGETFTLGARTPAATGICSSAFGAIYPMVLAMRLTDRMDWEKDDYFDITCPHGGVTFRISRIRETET